VGTAPYVSNPFEERAYLEVLERYTGHGEVYSQLDTHLFAAATYQSLRFREARARREAQFQALSTEQLQGKLAKESADAAQTIELTLAVFVNDFHYDDFDRKNSIWRLALETDVGEMAPIQVSRVGRAGFNIRAYYPYAGDFWTVYTLRFPVTTSTGLPVIGPNTQKVKLKVASTLGQLELTMDAP
jgi:hypothetical protein